MSDPDHVIADRGLASGSLGAETDNCKHGADLSVLPGAVRVHRGVRRGDLGLGVDSR